MSGLIRFYNQILACGSLTSDVEGRISATIAGARRVFTIKGKNMVLPTRELMKNPDKEGLVFFHPLNESLLRGETPEMEAFRKAINITLNMRLNTLLGELIELASSPARHSKLTVEHLDLIMVLKDADEKTFAAYEALSKAMPPGDNAKCIAHIYLKKNAVIDRSYRRGAIVTFPLYEELCGDTSSAFGVKLRKKDLAAFKLLLEKIFPDIGTKNSYSRGGQSDLAPSLDALLKAVAVLGGQVNSVVEVYEDVIEGFGELRYTDDWVEAASNLEAFTNEARMIPTQLSADSVVEPTPAVAAKPALATFNMPATPAAGTLMPWAAQTQAQPAANVRTENGLLDMGALMRSNPALMAMAYNVMPGYGMPMQPSTGAAALRNRGNSWSNPMTQFGHSGV